MYYVLVRETRGYAEYVCGGDPAYFSARREEAACFTEEALALLDENALREAYLAAAPAGEGETGIAFTPPMPHYRLRFARARAGALVRRETAYLAVREETAGTDEAAKRDGMEFK